jgi:hypothetical protein
MHTPFPEVVRVPRGLVKSRLAWGIPKTIAFGLLCLAVLPIALMGTWYPAFVTVPLGIWIAYEAIHDPNFLITWIGELRFKRRYR